MNQRVLFRESCGGQSWIGQTRVATGSYAQIPLHVLFLLASNNIRNIVTKYGYITLIDAIHWEYAADFHSHTLEGNG